LSKLLIFSHRPVFVGKKASGPGVRVFGIARALEKMGHSVSIAEKGRKKQEKNGKIRFVPWTEARLSGIEKKYDCAFIQVWNSDKNFIEKIEKVPFAVDASPPLILEQSTAYTGKRRGKKSAMILRIMSLPLLQICFQRQMLLSAQGKGRSITTTAF
jgi:hypothetical protein